MRSYLVFRNKKCRIYAVCGVSQTPIKLFFERRDRLSFAETFKALSDAVRSEILERLRNGRLSAGEIAGHFDMTQATVSYHLKILKQADLIRETREKNFIFYELNLTVLEEIMVWLSDLKGET